MPLGHVSSRPQRRWFGILLAVALVDVVTVSTMFSRNQRLMVASSEAVTDGRTWAERLAHVSTLRRLAEGVAAPGGEVLGAHDITTDKARLTRAIDQFGKAADAVRDDLSSLAPAHRNTLETSLERVRDLTKIVATQADSVLDFVQQNQFEGAAREMAAMNRTVAAVNSRLSEIDTVLGAVREERLAEQRDGAAQVRRTDLLIAGLNLVLVVTAVVYARSAAEATAGATAGSAGVLNVQTGEANVRPAARGSSASGSGPVEFTVVSTDATSATLEDFPSELESAPRRRVS